MKKSQEFALRRKACNLNALCGIKDYVINDGPGRGVRSFDLKNGRGIDVTIAADRGLDIPFLSYHGMSIGYNACMGVRSPYMFAEDGERGFRRQFFAGMMTTCGISYAGAAGEDEGEMLGIHGVFNNTPAENVRAERTYEGDDVVLKVSGDIREGSLVMHRELILETERDVLRIQDVLENQGYTQSPVMLVYHVNFGYPLLDAGAQVYTSAGKVEPRNDFAAQGMDKYFMAEEPEDGRDEQCYFHSCYPHGKQAFAMLENRGTAGIVRFDKDVLPMLCQWKNMCSGAYVMGLEPTTSGVLNRKDARENGTLSYIAPGESRRYCVEIELTRDENLISEYKSCAKPENR